MSAREDQVVLNVLLKCEETKSSETKQVQFQSLPTTPLEIKKKIEEDFSIPSCVQTLHYQSMILKDSDQLQHTHFRSGDTFSVDYPAEAECEMAKTVIKWLEELYELLKSIEDSTPDQADEEKDILSSNCRKIENLIYEGERDGTMESFSLTLFSPFGDKKKQINRIYFQEEGGLALLMKVYRVLISKEWGDLGIDKTFHVYMERKCSQAVCNYADTFVHAYGHQIVQLGAVEMSTTTLLRRRLQGDDDRAVDDLMYTTRAPAPYTHSTHVRTIITTVIIDHTAYLSEIM